MKLKVKKEMIPILTGSDYKLSLAWKEEGARRESPDNKETDT